MRNRDALLNATAVTYGSCFAGGRRSAGTTLTLGGRMFLHTTPEWDAPELTTVPLVRGADITVRDGAYNVTSVRWAKHRARIKAPLS
jgi:hypothetical protein